MGNTITFGELVEPRTDPARKNYLAKVKKGYIATAARTSDDICSSAWPGFSSVTSTSQVAPTVRNRSAGEVTICAVGKSAPSFAITLHETGSPFNRKRTRK